IGVAMGWYPEGSTAGWIASVIGAVIVLFIYNMVRSKSVR
ncbi:MAG: GlsB/YeaQ/YmgE family stress response membrane protein, partial [Comamonas sp.]